MGMYGRKVYLSVDNTISTGILSAGDILSIAEETLYLGKTYQKKFFISNRSACAGGLPDLSYLSKYPAPYLPIPYKGCMRLFSINSQHIPLDSQNIRSSRNIADCDGTPCGGDFCENGGSCWLDANLNPICLCPDPYQGVRCEKIPECHGRSCHNGGRCLNSKCICTVGYTGVFCETTIEVKTPKFRGASYLIVNSAGDKKRELKDVNVKSVYLNFTTAQRDGLILWSSKASIDI